MAVAFDTVGPSSAGAGTSGAGTATSASWSHTCSGSNRLVVVGVAVGANNSAAITTTATFGGTSMTSLGSIASNNQNVGYVQMFWLLNPPTGASTVALSLTGAATICAGSTSFTGASGVGTAATGASATSPSVVVSGTTSGNMVVDTACTGTSITSSNQTPCWLKNTDVNTAAGNGAGSTAAAGGSVTMSYTVSSDWSGIVAVEVLAAATSSSPRLFMNQAVNRAAFR